MIIRLKFLCQWLVVNLFFIIFSPFIFATTQNMQSVAGHWQTFDGKTKKISSIIKIQQQGQFFVGRIIKTFPVPGEKAGKYCTKCKGDQKNKPILGLMIVKRMICESGYCSHGRILDPRNGAVYHATLKLIDHGQFLKVRGYVGVPMFGKTVIWRRASLKSAQ